jgi:hypothetical protein
MVATDDGERAAGGSSGGFVGEQQLDLIEAEAGGLAQPDDVEALRVSLRQAQIQEVESQSDECKSAAQNQFPARKAGPPAIPPQPPPKAARRH